MPRRTLVFVVLAVALAALCARLGFWQLDRLAERREANAESRAQLDFPEVPFDATMRYAARENRRVVVRGMPDWPNEIVLAGRSRNGSPGVHILTPVRLASDTSVIVIVNRGWVYAADAKTADLTRWRESRTAFRGYTRFIGWPRRPSEVRIEGRTIRTLSGPAVNQLLPHGAALNYVVDQDSITDSTPARLPLPALDEGPHLSYAIQWFSFAAIALVGSAIVVRRSRVAPVDSAG